MNFLILPGAGDPFHESSIKATNLLINYAKENKCNKIECISYPGHKSFIGYSDYNLEITSTKQTIINAVIRFEDYQEDYIVFVRSYGCNPFLDVLANEKLKLKYLNKSIVWGSSAYHLIYKGATDLFDAFYKEGLKRGVKISKPNVSEIFPIECYVEKEVNHKVIFCTGAMDNDSPKHFYTYIKEINININNFFAPLIDSEKHTITEPNKQYEKLIFG